MNVQLKSFSEKVENRSLGVVGGLYGRLQWTTEIPRTPEKLDFLVLEIDCDHSDPNFKFARHKVNIVKIKMI